MKGLNDPSKTFHACKSTIKPRQTGYNTGVGAHDRQNSVLDKYSSMGINARSHTNARARIHTHTRKSRTLKIEDPTELIHRCADKGTRRCVTLH